MTFELDAPSRLKLAQVHPDLARVVEKATEISEVKFRVLEGVRTMARQRQLVAAGASHTLRSRHLGPVAHAVDLGAIVGNKVRWDWPLYHIIAAAMKQSAKSLGTPIEWGGDWKKVPPDGPHFQLPWKQYPVK